MQIGPEKEDEDVKGFPNDGKAIEAVDVRILEEMVANISQEVAHQLDGNTPDLQKQLSFDDLITRTLEELDPLL